MKTKLTLFILTISLLGYSQSIRRSVLASVGYIEGSGNFNIHATVGQPIAGTLQSDSALVNVAAAADPNAYATTIDIEVAGITTHAGVNSAGTAAVTSGVELMGMPPTVTSNASYTYAPSATALWSASGEKVVPVVGLLTLGGAQSGGCFHWWVDYAFDANIVWTQAALA